MMAAAIYDAWGTERVIFGAGALNHLAEEVERLGARRLLMMVSATLMRSPLGDELRRMLGSRAVCWQLGMPQHMPRPAIVELANRARAESVDLIVALGGGSIVDSAKMVQFCLSGGIRRTDQFDAFAASVGPDGNMIQPQIGEQTIRAICLPTTLSAAEFSGRAGSLDPDQSIKHIFVHRAMAPQVIILDPKLTVSTPDHLWFSSGIRAVDHSVESYCSPKANALSRAQSRVGLQMLVSGLRRCREQAQDLDARLDCQIGAWYSISTLQAGSAMGASHGIGHALGAFGVLHGETSCVMLGPVLRFNRKHTAVQQREIAAMLGDSGADAADLFEQLVSSLGLPIRLREVGIARDQLPAVAETAMQDRWTRANPRKINSPDEVLGILEAAW